MPERETMQRARVREGRDGSHSGGKTWSAIDQAGNCHWAFEGEARGSEIAGSRIGGDAEESGAGYARGEKSAQSFGQAVAGNRRRAEARRTFGGVARGAFAASEEERSVAREGRTQPGGEEGGGYAGAAGGVAILDCTALRATAGSSTRRRFAPARSE
jgi:hypothetical protein